MNVSMYEDALRKKLRFGSLKGELSLEQLWDVPLTSRDDFNLDVVAKTVNKALKEVSEESFVSTRKSAMHTELELKLDIVKHVISVKIEEVDKAKRRADNKQEREKLLEALERKKDAKYEGMSEAAIKKKLAELDDD